MGLLGRLVFFSFVNESIQLWHGERLWATAITHKHHRRLILLHTKNRGHHTFLPPLSLTVLGSSAFGPYSVADGFMQIWPTIFDHSKYHFGLWVNSETDMFLWKPTRTSKIDYLVGLLGQPTRLWFPVLVTLSRCRSVKSYRSPWPKHNVFQYQLLSHLC